MYINKLYVSYFTYTTKMHFYTNYYKERTMKKFYASLLLLLAVASSALALNFGASESQAAVWNERDYSDNAIIKGGAMTRSELKQKVNNSTELQKLFAHVGISKQMIDSGTVKDGLVYQNGNVTVGTEGNDKIVATDAHSVGRHYYAPNSEAFKVGDRTYYKRPTSNPHIFQNGLPQTAYIFYDAQGNYVGAIIKGCGNPIFSKPKEEPKPAPEYACVSVSRIKQADPNKYVFRAKSSVENGAKATGFTIEFGDGKSEKVGVERTEGKYAYADIPHTYAKAGTYNVKLTAHFTVNGKTVSKTAENCQKSVTIPKEEEKPAPVPEKEQVCELKSGRIITINEEDFDAELYSRDFDDCKMEVCVIDTKEVITIDRPDYDESIHTTDMSVCEEVEEEEVLGEQAPKPTPKGETPEVIASTGPAEIISGLFGSSALALGAVSYVKSRRALGDLF